MSIITCSDCCGYVDTDFDPAAYLEKLDKWVCERCREDYPACAYCDEIGESGEIREESPAIWHATKSFPASYICEKCFAPRDTGPCFDDLPIAEIPT